MMTHVVLRKLRSGKTMNRKIIQRSLLVSTALPVALTVAAVPSLARDVTIPAPVAPATSVSGADVNAAITAAVSSPNDAKLTLIAPSSAVVSGPSVQFNAAEGQGDGAVAFTNNGKFGAVSSITGDVTESVGVYFVGRPEAGASNSFTATNAGSGLVTGGLYATDFGGAVSIANAGTIHGGVYALENGGDVSVSNNGTVTGGIYATGDSDVSVSSSGEVRSGGVYAIANQTSTPSDPVDGVTTTTTTGGGATVAIDGNVASEDGSSRGVVYASGLGGANATVNAKAGSVTAYSAGTVSSVTQPYTAAANGSSAQVEQYDTTLGGGTATVAIGEGGDVTSVAATGIGGATATIAGEVSGNVSATSFDADGVSKYASAETRAADGVQTQYVVTSSTAPVGGAASTNIAEGGSVGGNVNTNGLASADATVDGEVEGNVSATSVGTVYTSNTQYIYANDGSLVQTVAQATTTPAGGAASINVGQTGHVEGSLIANGDAGASVGNSGNVEGGVYAYSARSLTLTNNSDVLADGTGSSTNWESRTVGGDVDVTNESGALIQSGVVASAVGDVTIVNEGVVRGTTSASSLGTASTYASTSQTTKTTATGTAPAPDITTTITSSASESSSTAIGGSVNGTYAGANGTLNFDSPTLGSVSQVANQDSTATVTGAIYGNLSSTAGSGTNSNSSSSSESTTILSDEVPTNGTYSYTSASESESSSAQGTSTVVIKGTVDSGNTGAAGNVSSYGTEASSVTVDSGKVGGTVTSGGYTSTTAANGSSQYDYVVTDGVYSLANSESSSETSTTRSGGAASAAVTGTSKVDGGLYVYGLSSASAVVGAKAEVGSYITVTTSGVTDTSSGSSSSYVADEDGVVTQRSTSASSSQAAAAGGDATLTMAGTLLGGASVSAGQGNATATITGIVDGGSVSATTGGTSSTSQTVYDYAGTVDDGVELTQVTATATGTAQGGTATIVVNSASTFLNKRQSGVTGDLVASGLGGASVSVAADNVVGGGIYASSYGYDSASTKVTSYAADGQVDSSYSYSQTARGGAVNVVNDGEVAGNVSASGVTYASITNKGTLGTYGYGNYFSANASNYDVTAQEEETHLENPALRRFEGTYAITPVAGNASFTNGADGIAFGDISVIGGTGTVTNDGIITGTTSVGGWALNGSAVVDATETNTNVTVTPGEELVSQTYEVNQNGVSGGIDVSGAVITQDNLASYASSWLSGTSIVVDPEAVDPDKFPLTIDGEKAVKTSDIAATVNLNDGSITLGDITAQRDDSGAYLTNTTVNLNGSGFLGASEFENYFAQYSPTPTLPEAAEGYFSTGGARVLGVTALNKTGDGTFVINGAAYEPAEASELQPNWTLDVGDFNIKAGEVQLGLDASGEDDVFGVKGNITNDATLVLGRRVPALTATVGDSLVSAGPETIDGISLYQKGNFTQNSTGTLVVNLNPSLVRYSPIDVSVGSSSGSEVLGPVAAGVNVYYFTTPSALGVSQTNSTVEVDGNVSLAGKVALTVSKDSLFSDGDGYTLFTYTGEYDGTGLEVTPSLSSPFVSFDLMNDTAAKTVKIEASRASYATAATNPNAVSAATALDSTLATVIGKIKADAAGESAFGSVTELGYAQDIANIAAGLDWRLNEAGAAAVFNELSSAEIYGSLAAIEQNSALTESFETAAVVGNAGPGLGLWINPVGRFARYGGTASGASKIRDNSYGGAIGINLGYSNNGGFGIGFAYAEHDIAARGTPETAKAKTYSLGVNWKHVFGPFQAGAQFVYGFSNFDVTRELAILDRTATASFKGRQWDGNVELGYNVTQNSNVTVLPYGKLALRHWTLGGFTEEGAAGVGLTSERDSKTVFVPEVGVRLGTEWAANNDVSVRPFGKLSYTFQGDVGSSRSFAYAAGGDSFVLKGVDPKGYGSVDGGISALFKERVGVFVQGGVNFGGSQKGAEVRGGINVRF